MTERPSGEATPGTPPPPAVPPEGRPRVAVILPAFNEEPSILHVLAEIPSADWVDDVIVVDNGSTDATAERARSGGAHVVAEPRRGYGSACLAGIAAARKRGAEVIVFLDADHSAYPAEMPSLLTPIFEDTADLVLGSRSLGTAEKGAVAPQAAFGNRLSTFLIRLLFRHRYTDLGPFKAIRASSLESLRMVDTNYGWNVEMQIKAIRRGLRIREVAVGSRARIGQSKISGTVRGTIGAGTKILLTIFRYAVLR